MFQNIGFTELLLIAIVGLLLFGPQKLPELGRAIGRTISEFKKGTRDLMNDVKTAPGQESAAKADAIETGGGQAPQAVSLSKEADVPGPSRRLPD